jgi:branched-chain amino acid transport system permease protein
MGTAMRALSEDRDAAALMGIDANRVIVFTFVLGACMAGIGGVLYCFVYNQIYFFTGFLPGIKAFAAAVLGGIGNIPGAMLGGILLGLIEALGAGYIGDFSDLCRWGIPLQACERGGHFILLGSNYQDVFAFIVLILVLVFRPQGLLGERVGDRA